MIRSWTFAIALGAVGLACRDSSGPPTTHLGHFTDPIKDFWESQCRTPPAIGPRDQGLVGVAPRRFLDREVSHFYCTAKGNVPLGRSGSTTLYYDGTIELYWDAETRAVTSFHIHGYDVESERLIARIEPLVSPFLPPDEWQEIRGLLASNRKHERRARDGSFTAWIDSDQSLDGPRSWSLRVAAR